MRQRSAEKSLTNAIIRSKPRRRLPLLCSFAKCQPACGESAYWVERKWSAHGHDCSGLHGEECVKKAPRQCGGFPFYLRTPDAPIVGAAPGTPIGAKVLPKPLPTAGTLGRGAAGPVFLHVGTTFVEPTVAGYEPTEGATTDPYPAVPSACASANVLVSVKAVASAIVVTFMRCPLLSSDRRQPHRLLDRSAKIFVRRDRSRQTAHISQSRGAPAIVVARHSPQALFDRAKLLEQFAIVPNNGSRVSLSCFHSSASTSQYSISEYSISFLASAARSRHMASNAANCFSEYMGFPVVLSLIRSLSRPTDNCVMRRDRSASMFPNVVIHTTNQGALVQLVGTRIKDNL
jgi:hypothetical protein